MQPYELRIHYAANNTVREDARWLSIAHGNLNFKPSRRLPISDTIVDSGDLTISFSENISQSQASTQLTTTARSPVFSQSALPIVEDGERIGDIRRPRASKRKASFSFESPPSSVAKRTKRTTFARTKKGLNPPFKNPIAGYLKTRKPGQASQETPRTCLASGKTVLVPFTRSPLKRRYPPSELNRPEHAMINPSSTDNLVVSCVDETSFMDHPVSSTDNLEVRNPTTSRDRIDEYSFDAQHYPGNQEQLRSSHRHRSQQVIQNHSASSSFHKDFGETEIDMGTWKAPSTYQRVTSASTTTTETPSGAGEYIDNSSPLAQKSAARHLIPVIDLTSPPDITLHVTRRDVLGPVSSPPPVSMGSGDSDDTPEQAGYRDILQLPTRLMCQATYTAQSRPFESFLPRYLIDLAEAFGLVNQFRPISAPTSIRNGDRGYWSIRVKVSDLATVAKARRSPLTSSQWSDKRFMMRQEGLLPDTASSAEGNDALQQLIYPNLNPEAYTPWTVDEFVTFWTYLARVVERGRAGYDVRATLKCAEAVPDKLHIDVRLYGYAETLSHLWLILVGVSDSLTSTMPLQWCIPGIGPLITMSGQPKHGGALSRWLPRGRGTDGAWGKEVNWEGLSSANRTGQGESNAQ